MDELVDLMVEAYAGQWEARTGNKLEDYPAQVRRQLKDDMKVVLEKLQERYNQLAG